MRARAHFMLLVMHGRYERGLQQSFDDDELDEVDELDELGGVLEVEHDDDCSDDILLFFNRKIKIFLFFADSGLEFEDQEKTNHL